MLLGYIRSLLVLAIAAQLLCGRAGALQIERLPLPAGVSLAPVRDQTERLLQSPDVRDRTWGAYLVGRLGWDELVPQLIMLLDPNWPFGSHSQRDLLNRATFDSLIQLDAKVDADRLLPHWESYPDETLILLAMDAERNQKVLLELAGNPAVYVRWLAISNLLAETRAPGFAALLLREVTTRVAICASDGGTGMGMGASFGSGGGTSSCGVLQVPVDYPPIATYKLTTLAAAGHRVVAPGRTVVYAERKFPHPPTGMGRCSEGLTGSSDEERMHYLAKLLETSVEALPLKQNSSHRIVFQDPAGFLQAAKTIAMNARSSFAALASQLLEAGLLTAGESSELAPRIIVTVHDARIDRSVPLPVIPGVEMQ